MTKQDKLKKEFDKAASPSWTFNIYINQIITEWKDKEKKTQNFKN